MPSNSGRIILFGFYGVPVISDAFPSALQLIQHGKNGFISMNSYHWRANIITLIENASLRLAMGKNLSESCEPYHFRNQIKQLTDDCNHLKVIRPAKFKAVGNIWGFRVFLAMMLDFAVSLCARCTVALKKLR